MDDANRPPFELTPADQRVLDAMLEAGLDADGPADGVDGVGSAAGDQSRAARARYLLELLNDYPVEDADDTLVHATLARVARAESERASRMDFDLRQEEATVRSPRRLRLPDFISVAAVILIAAGILWPTMAHVNRRATDQQCANQLRHVGYAFSNYRADFNDDMPMAIAGFGPGWSSDAANVVHLAPLVSGGYCDQGHLRCPGAHDHDDCSYSYQWQTAGVARPWASRPGTTVVLGDRNPLIDAYRASRSASAMAGSLNHGGRGQNVLSTDGAILWLVRPVIGSSDNIWLPAGATQLTEGETPGGGSDIFLAH